MFFIFQCISFSLFLRNSFSYNCEKLFTVESPWRNMQFASALPCILSDTRGSSIIVLSVIFAPAPRLLFKYVSTLSVIFSRRGTSNGNNETVVTRIPMRVRSERVLMPISVTPSYPVDTIDTKLVGETSQFDFYSSNWISKKL